jgi:hypothetical protein
MQVSSYREQHPELGATPLSRKSKCLKLFALTHEKGSFEELMSGIRGLLKEPGYAEKAKLDEVSKYAL